MRTVVTLFFALVTLTVSQTTPSVITPEWYYLNINVPDLGNNTSFNGSVQINFTLSSGVDYILLHATNLTINSSSVSVLKYSEFSEGWQQEKISKINNTGSFLNISFPSPLSGSNITVKMDFQGNFYDSMKGFAKVGYFFNHTLKYLAVTSLEPTNARRVFPCFDEPGYRTNFALDITVNKSLTVLSNVRPSSVQNTTISTHTFRFNNYPLIPLYQVGWAVLDPSTFVVRTFNSSDTQVYTRAPYPYSNHTSWSGQLTADLISYLSSYTKQPYPFKRMEQIVVPEFFTGTSEGWGIISYSEENILVTPEKTSERDTQYVALSLARGIIQQWFGDLVSMDSWENMWLVKGYAEYFKYNISASLPNMSSWELNDQMVVEMVQPALALDTSQHALQLNTQGDPQLIQSVYDDLTKYKGGAVIRMLISILGEDIFHRAFNIYLKKSVNKPSNPIALWNILYEAASYEQIYLESQSVDIIMNTWTKNAGYPVLNVTWNGTYYNISQPPSSPWFVPVTFVLERTPNVLNKTWLTPGGSVTIKPASTQWILVNINQTGYYRVNYDTELRQLLTKQLTSDLTRLPRLNRAQLIDDMFALMYRDNVSSDALLQFTGYLKSEVDYYVWHSALRNYQDLVDKFYGHSSYELLKSYVLSLMDKVIADTGMVAKPQDTHIDKIKRAMVLEKACALGHPDCLKKASSILRSWMNHTYYDADLNTALLCAGVSNSSTSVWWSVWEVYPHALVPSVRANILRALTCTRNTTLLYQFLTNVTSSSAPVVSSKDKTILLKTLASTPFGADVLLRWVLDTLKAQMSNSSSESNATTNIASSTTTTPLTSSTAPKESVKQTNVNSSTDSSQSAEESESEHPKRKATVVPPSKLLEEDVVSILLYCAPKLTDIHQGTYMELYLSLNDSNLSASTRQLMKNITSQVYSQYNWAWMRNGKITVWLEQSATTTPTGPSTGKPPSTLSPTSAPGSPTSAPGGASGLYSSFVLCVLVVVLHLRLTL